MPAQPQQFPPISELLRRQGIWLDKRKSQHFLTRQDVCAEIAELAGLGQEHLAVEVGAGLGNLTVELAARAGRVVSVEMDCTFEEWHRYLAASYGRIEFIYSDFLKVDLEGIVASHRGPLVGIGNLPYQITSDILFRFVDSPVTFDALVFMVQKEVAERIAAGAGLRATGALTYKIAMRYEAEIAFAVPPENFLPQPKVDSAVILLRPLAQSLLRDDAHRDRVYTVLNAIFRHRRKTLLNGLRDGGLAEGREEALAILAAAGIESQRRAESLSLDDVLRLTDEVPRR